MFWDSHIHSDVSFDGKFSYDTFVDSAKELGLNGITFTEHYDIYDGMDPHDSKARPFDKVEYSTKFSKAKENYGEYIKMGVEIGLRPDSKDVIKEASQLFEYDFIIGSSHIVHMKNVSHDYSFYEGLTKEESYDLYLKEVYDNINLCYHSFDVYGHLDYIARYGRYENSKMECTPTLDEVLKILITKGKGIEINTASFRQGANYPHPNFEIIKRYHELGGEIITLGSDAHIPEHLGYSFKDTAKALYEIGFNYYCVFDKRNPKFIKFNI